MQSAATTAQSEWDDALHEIGRKAYLLNYWLEGKADECSRNGASDPRSR